MCKFCKLYFFNIVKKTIVILKLKFEINGCFLSLHLFMCFHWSPGPPRGSVGPGAKYLFGGPDDVIMYSSGTRVYRTLRSSALKSSDCIFRGLLGHSPEKFLNLGSLKWHFLHFASVFEQNLTT